MIYRSTVLPIEDAILKYVGFPIDHLNEQMQSRRLLSWISVLFVLVSNKTYDTPSIDQCVNC